MGLYELALAISIREHEGQTRKGGDPYIVHPLRVAESGVGEEEKVVGLLHDVLEDCSGQHLYKAEMPKHIMDAVIAITRNEDEKYFDYIKRCCDNPLAAQVKVYDILDNWRTSKPSLKKRYLKALEMLFSAGICTGAEAEEPLQLP